MKLAFKLPHRFFLLLVPALLAANAGAARAQERPLYLDDQQPVEARVNDLLPRLTLEEKISLVHANANFSTAGVPRLGIPELIMDDGPLGVREEVGDHFHDLGHVDDFATAMPGALGLAATWNTNLAQGFRHGHRPGSHAARQRHHARAGGEHPAHAVVRPQF